MLRYERLANGIEVALKENHQSKAVSIQCWIKAGSLHEEPDERGMAHFIEHMLFKGTQKRGVGEIGHLVEACGGDINAYTTFDRTVFYLTLSSKHARLGVDLLSDAIFNSSFDANELEAEKKVVLEEIKRGLDDPSGKVGRMIFARCYSDSEAGRPVIGDAETVSSFNRDKVLKFYKRWYKPQNMSVVAVGDFESGAMLTDIKEYFSSSAASTKADLISWPKTCFPKSSEVTLIRDDFNLAKLEIVVPGPDARDVDSIALDIVSFVLGTGTTSRLNQRIREAEKAVVAIGASSFSPQFPGIFALSAHANESTYLKAVELLAKELKRLTTIEPITKREIDKAKINLLSDKLYRDETAEGQAKSLGYGLTTPEKVYSEDAYHATVNAMTPELIQSAVERWFALDTAVIVGLIPKDSQLSEKQVLDAYQKGLQSVNLTPVNKPSENVNKKGTHHSREPNVVDIADGIRFVYRQVEDCQLFALTAATEGGSRSESPEEYGQQNAFSNLIALESTEVAHKELVHKIEELGASLSGFSGKDSLGASLHCLAKDSQELTDLMLDTLLHPVFPEEQWELFSLELKETFATQDDSPSALCFRKFQEKLFGSHPYATPSYGTKQTTSNFDRMGLCQKFVNYASEGPWVFAAVGPFKQEVVAKWLREKMADFVKNDKKRSFAAQKLIPTSKISGSDYFFKEREQSHIAYGYLGLDWFDPDRAALDVLVNILGGHGGRLFVNLREKQSLAYAVAPVISYGCHPGVIASYIACAPDKSSVALAAMKQEFRNLCEQEPTKNEVERAINYISGSHEMGLQKTDAQSLTMALMEVYGIGYDDYLLYPKQIEKVTPALVKKVAQRLFSDEGYAVIVGPKSCGGA
ncbi:MAG: pitrilysin family protein [Bdellovibrionota bacterium]